MLTVPVPIFTQNFNPLVPARSKDGSKSRLEMAPMLTEAPPFQGHLTELVFCLPDHKARVSGKGLNLGDFSVPYSTEINGCFSAAARQL